MDKKTLKDIENELSKYGYDWAENYYSDKKHIYIYPGQTFWQKENDYLFFLVKLYVNNDGNGTDAFRIAQNGFNEFINKWNKDLSWKDTQAF
jgi:hypothetical protein